MSASGHLRLAWQAERAGRARLRDVMLTLAIAEGGADEPWAERCRLKLVRERPEHFFAQFGSLEEALASEEVRKAIVRLREKYPPSRVEWMLLAGDASRGHFTGTPVSRAALLQDLLGPPAEADVRRDPAEALRGPIAKSRKTVASLQGVFGGHSVVDVSPLGVGLDGLSSTHPWPDENTDSGETAVQDESLSAYYLGVLFSIALLLSATSGKPHGMRRAG